MRSSPIIRVLTLSAFVWTMVTAMQYTYKSAVSKRVPARPLWRLLILLIGPINPSVFAATSTATVSALVTPIITITNQSGMIFGEISAGATTGTIIIAANGTRTSTGGASVNSATAGGPASFEIVGNPSGIYSISLPAAVIISAGGGSTMTVDNFTSSPSVNGALDASGRQTLLLGSTLNVGIFQPFGAYSGVMAVTVNYN